jgi:FkbM family methyltransferase
MFRNLSKRWIRRFGYDLRRYRPASSEAAQVMAMLSTHKVNLIFDVGANIGQFGQSLRDAGYSGRIVSFEPLSAAREQLLEASQKDPLWQVASRAAIGSEDGEIEIHVAANLASSSVLDMLDAHAVAAPESAYIGKERVPLRRLDTLATDYLLPDSKLFIKIDTQGFEDRVLQGATKLLERAVGLDLELSLIPLYDGQRLYDDMVSQLKALGFELWAMTPVFVDPESGRLLQVDAIFFRR